MPSIGVIAAVHTYYQWLPAWEESLRNLNRKPDRIVIAASNADEVSRLVSAKVEVIQVDEPWQFGTYLNIAIQNCPTDWIVWTGLDDCLLPHALDRLDSSDADVFAFGLTTQHLVWCGGDFELEAGLEGNPIPCGSPFRRSLWEQIPFQPHLAPYEDWALWIGFKLLNARIQSSRTVDYIYRLHDDSPNEVEPTRARIKQWAATVRSPGLGPGQLTGP